MIKTKKAGAKYLSVWWFFILVLISVGLVVGISANIFAETNVKKIESKILLDRTVNCLIKNGQINQGFLNNNFDFYKNCSFNKETFDKYFVEIKVYDFDSCENNENNLECSKKILEKSYGDLALKTNCEILKSVKAKNFPSCSKGSIYTLNVNNKLIIEITTGSNQEGGR